MDANGCSLSTTAIVKNVAGALVTATAVNASCGLTNGFTTASGTGGLLPYQYSINGTVFQASSIFSNLAPNNYTFTIKDANNCISTTGIVVAAGSPLSVNAGPDISICAGASTQLAASTNGINFTWLPQAGLNDPLTLNPVATPATTTDYILTATTGQCSKSDTVRVFVNTAPVANAGPDAVICFGKNYQLSGGGGTIYQWSPPAYLSNAGIANPQLVSPSAGTFQYILKVTDINGCTSVKSDTVAITVLPRATIFAGADTTIFINQPLQLHGIDVNNNDFISYLWSPSMGFNNPLIQDPVATISTNTRYLLTAITRNGCTASDDIVIQVITIPDLFVPSAFSPNGDGLNDVIKVIPRAIKQLNYFKIYNRWGELVFNTSDPSIG